MDGALVQNLLPQLPVLPPLLRREEGLQRAEEHIREAFKPLSSFKWYGNVNELDHRRTQQYFRHKDYCGNAISSS